MSLDYTLGLISPMSPYYKDNPADNPKFTCAFCWYEFDMDCIIIESTGDKACPECHEYNLTLENQ